jgi:diguanylate cyclase (GGDEF)-like protein
MRKPAAATTTMIPWATRIHVTWLGFHAAVALGSYGLLILDLDRFKAINDEHGHLAGDGVLRAASDALRAVLRAGDSTYRYGGDEFVALILLTRPPEALVAAERIRAAIEALHIPNARNAPYGYLTTSVGVTTIGPLDLAADDAARLARVDAGLYRAKTNGRNRAEAGWGDGTADGADRWSSPADRGRIGMMPGVPWSAASTVPGRLDGLARPRGAT